MGYTLEVSTNRLQQKPRPHQPAPERKSPTALPQRIPTSPSSNNPSLSVILVIKCTKQTFTTNPKRDIRGSLSVSFKGKKICESSSELTQDIYFTPIPVSPGFFIRHVQNSLGATRSKPRVYCIR